MSQADGEVKVKLVVDSNAAKVAEGMKQSLHGVAPSAATTGKRIDAALGANFSAVKRIGMSAFGAVASGALAAGSAMVGAAVASAHAFQESEAQVKMLTASFLNLNEGIAGFAELKSYAADVKDELEELGMKAGVADDELVNVFNNIIERGGKSVEQAKELTESFAQAGRALPNGAADISAAYEAIEMGMIKAKNPIVGMIAATHLLSGNAKSVAKQMNAMKPEEQMALAEKAIARMGNKMKDVPLTFGQLMTSMNVAWGNLFETAGEPIMKALTPVVAKVRDLFFANKDELGEMAKSFGTVVGQIVDIAGPVVSELFRAMKDSSGEIKQTFEALYGPAHGLFEYIYENKDSFAKTLGDVLKMMIHVAATLVQAFAKIRDSVMGVLGAIGKQLPGVGKFAAEEKQKGQINQMQGAVKSLGLPGQQLDDATYNKMRADFIKTAQEGGLDIAQAGSDFDNAYRGAVNAHKSVLSDVAGARDAAMNDDAVKYAQMFDIAAKANDKGAQQYVLEFLAGNQSLQNALSKAGPDIFKTGFENFSKALTDYGGGDVAKSIKAGMVKIGPTTKVTQNFSGPISIKQDFKDADPDRILVAFKEKLASEGANRLSARGAAPFGF